MNQNRNHKEKGDLQWFIDIRFVNDLGNYLGFFLIRKERKNQCLAIFWRRSKIILALGKEFLE